MALLERDAELRTLSEAWQQARTGGPGSFLLVAGESGIGKTWLTSTFVREHVPDEQLLWGLCDPLSTPRPLGPLHDVADQLPPVVREAMESSEHGYQVFPAACGARYATSAWRNSRASPMMSSADAPRPCTRIMARRAWSGLGPVFRTG